jgi:phosphatidylinositol glycan class O
VLIIDSLRFDFIAPAPYIPSESNAEYSVHHHSTLTLPSLLTDAHPQNSFIFNSYPDPPTTTLQRIKGLTTGSLPTFVDMGSNFGGSEIEDDSIIAQVGMNGKEVGWL